MAVHFPQNKVTNAAYDGDRLSTMSPGPTRILILGGGFGGVYTALTLEQLLRHDLRRGAVEIALVNRENYMVFQPMLPELISGSKTMKVSRLARTISTAPR